jgi:predicted outer membrane lipoprotein
MKRRGLYFVLAAAFAIAAALNIADYGDGSTDRLHVILESLAAIGFLILGLRAGRSAPR